MTVPSRPAPLATRLLLGVLRGLAAAWLGYAALSLAVRLWVASARLSAAGPWLRVVLINPTILLGLSAILVLWLVRPEAGWGRAQRRSLLGIALGPPVLALAIAAIGCQPLAQLGVLAPYIHQDTGRLGFAPNHCYRERRGQAAPVTLCTDATGGRAAATAGQGAPEVWVLVGDSFVFGSGVADDQTLAQHVARTLAASQPSRAWTVVNAGFPGLSLSSYVKLLRSRLAAVKPTAVVVGFNAGNDLDPADTWQRLAQLGEHLVVLSAVLGVEGDLYPLEQADEARWRDEAQIPPAIREQFESNLNELLALQREHGFRLLIWSYYGPTHLFDRAQLSGQLQVAWPEPGGWGSDPQLHIVGDGHPTALANRAFAQQLVGVLRGSAR